MGMDSLRMRFINSLAKWLLVPFCFMAAVSEATAKPGEPVKSGDLRSPAGFYSVVFYYTPKPAQDPLRTASDLMKELLPEVMFVETGDGTTNPPFVSYEQETAPLENYPVPDAGYFKYAGRGMSPGDIKAIQGTAVATQLVFIAKKDDIWKHSRPFTELVHSYAERTGAFIWDSATRECFSREVWKKKRLDDWKPEMLPDIASHTTIHLYRADEEGGYLRAITLGMEKFALPDVVIEKLGASDNRPAGNLINLVCQLMAENPEIKDASRHEFRIDSLKSASQREKTQSTLLDGARGAAVLALIDGIKAEGDPDNRLVEISFANGAGDNEDERRKSILSTLWGAKDSVTGAKHSDEVLAASEKARVRLAALRPAFIKGLPPGERLLVKAPFKRDDQGNEWMWVEVLRWPEEMNLEGLLQNDPFYIKKLKAGSRVILKFAELFDYIHYRADGTEEGNETGKLIEKQQGPKQDKE
jgi:uncharacterized protein YegJ (DUF2314 family)